MVVCAEPEFPAASRTVSVTVQEPALAKTWSAVAPEALAPSPRSHDQAVMPVSSVDAPASRWTESGATPDEGEAVKAACGGLLSAGAVTAICFCALPPVPAAPIAVSVAGQVPREAERGSSTAPPAPDPSPNYHG